MIKSYRVFILTNIFWFHFHCHRIYKMEQEIDKVLDDTIANDNIAACLSANRNGLCIGARGDISQSSSGVLVALLDQAQKLEPQSGSPVVILETSKNACLIHKHGVTGVIVKNLDKST